MTTETRAPEVDTMASFGDVVRQKRIEKGYSQEMVALFLGISVSYVSRLENGTRAWTPKLRGGIVEFLGWELMAYSSLDSQNEQIRWGEHYRERWAKLFPGR